MKWTILVVATALLIGTQKANADTYMQLNVPCTPGEEAVSSGDFQVRTCYRCQCFLYEGTPAASCYALYGVPTDYDKTNCEAHFDEEKCLYRVTRKDDPEVECEIKAMVGK